MRILYHKSNLVYTVFFPQFWIFQQNNSALTSVLIFFTSRHYYFFEKLEIVKKNLCKLNCSYAKVSHTLIKMIKGLKKLPVQEELVPRHFRWVWTRRVHLSNFRSFHVGGWLLLHRNKILLTRACDWYVIHVLQRFAYSRTRAYTKSWIDSHIVTEHIGGYSCFE